MSELIDSRICRKYLYTNFYGIDYSDTSILKTENSLFISKDFGEFSRIYILSNEKDEIVNVLSKLSSNSVINIPSRKGIEDWIQILNMSGYRQIALYHRYIYRKYPQRRSKKLEFANEKDHSQIAYFLKKYFSPITGHLPNDVELFNLIANKNILVNRDNEHNVNGAICFNIENKKCYLAFWFDESGMGLSLLNNVFSICSENDVKTICFWVNEENVDVIKMHTLFGALPDGMKDYIFNNNINENGRKSINDY